MKRLVFLASLSAALSLVGAENAYVNAASAAPESPYDTWAKAATLYEDAYGAVDAGGTITFSEGTYTDSASLSDKSVVIRAVKSPADESAGTVTMGGTLYSAKFANNTDASKYRLTYAKGTFTYVANNVFSDYPAGSWGLSPRFAITFTGPDTCMDASSSTMYACYGCKNSTVRFADGANGTVAKLYLGSFAGKGDGGTFVIDSAATLTCSGDANVGIKDGEKDFSLVVSNGVFSCSGANGLAIGSSTSGSNRLVVAGATPRITLSKAFFYNALLSFNVGAAPLSGYSEPPVTINGGMGFDANSQCEIVGLPVLKERLDAAGVVASSLTLLTLGDGNTFPKSVLGELESQVAQLPGFQIELNRDGQAGSLVLKYLPQTVYVVPAGTDGNVPTAPYATWATAANSVKEAESAVAIGGKVVIASGTYDVGETYFLRDERIELRAVASQEAEDEPGEVTIPNYGFATGYANTDNDVFNASLTYGKFNFNVSSKGHAFVEYLPDRTWGKNCNCKLTLSGPHTVISQSTVELYSGYTSQNTVLRVTDHASVSLKQLLVGDLKHANGSTVIVDNGGTVTNEQGFVIGRFSNNNRLLITNAVYVTSWIQMGAAETFGSTCVLAGENPKLLLTASGTPSEFLGESDLVFDVGDASLSGYAVAPLTGYRLSFDDSFAVSVEGCDRLKDRLVAADQRKLTLDLIHSKDGNNPVPFSDERLASIQATLPERFSISKTADGAKVQLRYRVPSGMAIILR